MSSNKRIELFPEKVKITEGRLSCVSLFSGILGLELGLHKAGFSTRVAIDIDRAAKETALLNFKDLDYVEKDVSEVTASFVLDRIQASDRDIDLLAGGPPCQPFSKSGNRNGVTDSRGMLFEHYVRLLAELRPRAFILENVRGIVSSREGRDLKLILAEFGKTGYTMYWKVLDAANYGVPQFRQRLFLVGFKDRIRFSFPESTHGNSTSPVSAVKPFVTAQDAIGDLGKVEDFPQYRGMYAHLLKDIPEGLNYSYYCRERGHPNPLFRWRSKFWYFLLKMDRNSPSLTIQAYPGNNTGPFHWDNRKLGISELKRLQTIPDWFEMRGSYLTKHRLIGNAVPPLLAHRIGVQIARVLDENVRLSDHEYRTLKKENTLLGICSGRKSGKGRLFVIDGKKVMLDSRRIEQDPSQTTLL